MRERRGGGRRRNGHWVPLFGFSATDVVVRYVSLRGTCLYMWLCIVAQRTHAHTFANGVTRGKIDRVYQALLMLIDLPGSTLFSYRDGTYLLLPRDKKRVERVDSVQSFSFH